MAKDINSDTVFSVNIEKLALDSRFGALKFENASKKLEKIQSWLGEVHELAYQNLLLDSDANLVRDFTARLIEYLQWLQRFDITSSSNPKNDHDNFNRQVDDLYSRVYKEVVMKSLPFLREERRRENPAELKTDEEIKKLVQLRKELEEELKNVRAETERIHTTGKEVGSAKGERAAARLAAHFDAEADRYQTAADQWYTLLRGGYLGILAIVVAFGAWYWFGKAVLTWQSAGAKLVLVAALWYGLSFLIRNYNVNSHLAAVNRHRAAVARTLEDFIAVEQQQTKPRLQQMLRNATEAMFKHAPIGFISRAEKDNSSPVYEVINNIMGSRSTQ